RRVGAAHGAAHCGELAAAQGSVQRALGSGRLGPGALAALRSTGGRAAGPGESWAHSRDLGARDRTRRRSPSRTSGSVVVASRDHAPHCETLIRPASVAAARKGRPARPNVTESSAWTEADVASYSPPLIR